jgi:G3E family GTPase
VKGIINVAGESQPVVVHGVQSVSHVPVALKAWPSADRRSCLVFIVQGIDRQILEENWRSFHDGTA